LKRTVRDVELGASREIFQKVYGSAVELFRYRVTPFEGVHAVIHLASPLPGRVDPASTIDNAVLGSKKIVRQGIEAGVKWFSIASSGGAAVDFANLANLTSITEDDWNPATREQAIAANDPWYTYCASKALSEKAVNEIGEAHPDVNIAIMNPSYLIGPFAPTAIIAPGDINALSTNLCMYNALLPDSKSITFNVGYMDVRDAALAMIAGLNTPGKTRNLLTGEWFELKVAVEYVGSLHPELKLPTLALSGQTHSIFVCEPAWRWLGLTPRPWKDMVREAAEAVLKVERDWVAHGIDVDAEGGLRKNAWRA